MYLGETSWWISPPHHDKGIFCGGWMYADVGKSWYLRKYKQYTALSKRYCRFLRKLFFSPTCNAFQGNIHRLLFGNCFSLDLMFYDTANMRSPLQREIRLTYICIYKCHSSVIELSKFLKSHQIHNFDHLLLIWNISQVGKYEEFLSF